MKLSIDHDPEFQVHIEGATSNAPLRIEVTLASAPKAEAFRQVEAHVQVWIAAAMYGMGAGIHVPPKFHGDPIKGVEMLQVQDATPDAHTISFQIDGLIVDPTYAVVLIQKLYCLAEFFVPLDRVALTLPGVALNSVDFGIGFASTVPELHPALPFACTFDPETGDFILTVTLLFAKNVDQPLHVLREGCAIWCAQVVQGGYASRDFPPNQSSIQPDGDDFEITGNEVVFTFEKVFMDMRAVYGLIHFFAAFSTEVMPIMEVDIM